MRISFGVALAMVVVACQCDEHGANIPFIDHGETIPPVEKHQVGFLQMLPGEGIVARYDREDVVREGLVRVLHPSGDVRFEIAVEPGVPVAVSHSGQLVAYGDASGTMVVNLMQPAQRFRMEGLRRPRALVFGPDDSVLVELEGHGRLRWLDPVNAAVFAELETRLEGAETIHVAADGSAIEIDAARSSCRVAIPSGDVACRDSVPERPAGVVSASGDRRASIDADHAVSVQDAHDGALLGRWFADTSDARPVALAFSEGGREIAIGMLDGTIEKAVLYGPMASAPALPPMPLSIIPSVRPPDLDDQGRVLSVESGTVPFGSVVWLNGKDSIVNVAEGAASESIDVVTRMRSGLIPPVKGRATLVVPVKNGFAHAFDDGMLLLSTTGTSEPVSAHDRAVAALDASRDGTTVATADLEGHVRVWRTEGSRPSMVAETTIDVPVAGLAFAADGRSLWVVGTNGRIARWRIDQREPSQVAFADGAGAIALSHKGDRIAISRKGGIDIRDVRSGTVLAGYSADGDPSSGIAWSSDDKLVAIATPEGASVWDLSVKSLVASLPSAGRCAMHAVSFHPKKPVLAASGSCSVVVWNVKR